MMNSVVRCTLCNTPLADYEMQRVELLVEDGICMGCWLTKAEAKSVIMRRTIARRLCHLRAMGERMAAQLYRQELKGTGVPPNPKRRRHGKS